jgi:hypothetical protein
VWLAGPAGPYVLGQHIEHPPIDNRRTELDTVPKGFKAYETLMACINEQRKLRCGTRGAGQRPRAAH